jgi:hypothetical protein
MAIVQPPTTNPALEARLARLANRATRYEVAATDGARSLLVGYTRKTSHGLRDLLRGTVEGQARVVLLATATATDPYAWEMASAAGDGARCGPWTVNFTGRTQRGAYIEGELPDSIYAG